MPKSVEKRLEDLESELRDLKRLVADEARRAERRRKATQSAVDDLQKALGLIFKNVHVPNVIWNPDNRNVVP